MLFLFFLLIIGLVWFLIVSYNKLQRFAQGVRKSHSNIMVSMKKRFDLANRLMDITASYGEHEKFTHISIADSLDVASIAGLNTDFNQAISKISSIATQFPDLKANATYQQLMNQLTNLEEDLQRARNEYNNTVQDYNNCRSTIPQVLFASKFGFSEANYFDVDNADNLSNLANFRADDNGEYLQQAIGNVAGKIGVQVNKFRGDKTLPKD